MAALDTYYQGESIPLTITISDSDGNALDLDSLDAIEIKVYHKNTHVAIGTYTLAAETVVKTTPDSGICDIKINSSDTTDAMVGTYRLQTKTTETDTDYEDDTRYRFGQSDAFKLEAAI